MDFSKDPEHSDDLLVRDQKPFNAEPDVVHLVEHDITPENLVYCRNHCPIRTLDANTFTLKIEGAVEKELSLNLASLKAFPRAEVVAALQCAGNRRAAMAQRSKHDVEGLMWKDGTIANCRWAGARLKDVILHAGLKVDATTDPETGAQPYATFASHVVPTEQDDRGFGASIELARALDDAGDVLIAYEMNSNPLSVDHGAPFRIVVPGYSGARWVKWLDTISIGPRPSDNFYQQRDYKVLPATVRTHEQADSEDWWSKIPALSATSLNSIIASLTVQPPSGASTYPPAPFQVLAKGYAVGGASGGQVVRVEVSVDAGASWEPARITYQDGEWSWTLWDARVEIGIGGVKTGDEREVWCRATDKSGETQQAESDWNLRGVAYCGYGKMKF